MGEVNRLVEVTFCKNTDFFNVYLCSDYTVKCADEQEFLVYTSENNVLNYKDSKLTWVKAADLREGMKLVTENNVIEIKDVSIIKEKADVYSAMVIRADNDEQNFSIKLGVVVKGE